MPIPRLYTIIWFIENSSFYSIHPELIELDDDCIILSKALGIRFLKSFKILIKTERVIT